MTESLELLVDELQAAYKKSSGAQPSNDEHIRARWRKVASHILSGVREKSDTNFLAVELHLVFIGEGHRTEIEHRGELDPVLLGWRGVASWVIEQQRSTRIEEVSYIDSALGNPSLG